jgi:hypothetical protein
MRRLASLFVLAFAMVALVGLPTAAHDREHDRVRHNRAPNFAVLVGSARQGGTMLIAVRVGPPRWHHRRSRAKAKELTATAVVHFASGDVQATLTPRKSKARFLAWSKGRGYPGALRVASRGKRIWGKPFWAPRTWHNQWTLFAKVPVGAEETVGRVAVDVTITYGDTTAVITTYGKVKAAKSEPEPPTETSLRR